MDRETERKNIRNVLISLGLTAIAGAGIVGFNQEIYDAGNKAYTETKNIAQEILKFDRNSTVGTKAKSISMALHDDRTEDALIIDYGSHKIKFACKLPCNDTIDYVTVIH